MSRVQSLVAVVGDCDICRTGERNHVDNIINCVNRDKNHGVGTGEICTLEHDCFLVTVVNADQKNVYNSVVVPNNVVGKSCSKIGIGVRLIIKVQGFFFVKVWVCRSLRIAVIELVEVGVYVYSRSACKYCKNKDNGDKHLKTLALFLFFFFEIGSGKLVAVVLGVDNLIFIFFHELNLHAIFYHYKLF